MNLVIAALFLGAACSFALTVAMVLRRRRVAWWCAVGNAVAVALALIGLICLAATS